MSTFARRYLPPAETFSIYRLNASPGACPVHPGPQIPHSTPAQIRLCPFRTSDACSRRRYRKHPLPPPPPPLLPLTHRENPAKLTIQLPCSLLRNGMRLIKNACCCPLVPPHPHLPPPAHLRLSPQNHSTSTLLSSSPAPSTAIMLLTKFSVKIVIFSQV